MPYPKWTDPQVIYAADLNTLTSQGIARFTSAAQRAAAIGVPVRGQVTWVDGVGYQEFDGAAWVPFVPGGRLLGGRRYPGTAPFTVSVGASEAWAGMESGPVDLEGGKRYTVDLMAVVSSAVAGDTAQLRVREDDGNTHLTGQGIGYLTTHALAITDEKYLFHASFDIDADEDMTRTYVATVRRVAGSGALSVWRLDPAVHTASPKITVRESGLSTSVPVGTGPVV